MRLILIICLISINCTKNIELISSLNKDINVDLIDAVKQNKTIFTYLIVECHRAKIKMVKFLIKKGANINQEKNYQHSPLDILIKNEKFEVAALPIRNYTIVAPLGKKITNDTIFLSSKNNCSEYALKLGEKYKEKINFEQENKEGNTS